MCWVCRNSLCKDPGAGVIFLRDSGAQCRWRACQDQGSFQNLAPNACLDEWQYHWLEELLGDTLCLAVGPQGGPQLPLHTEGPLASRPNGLLAM